MPATISKPRLPDALIDYIMDRFDFEHVHRTMQALDWKWVIEGRMEVPDRVWLRQQAREMLQSLIAPGSTDYISTGGFVARRSPDDCVSLEFVVDGAVWCPGDK